MMGGQHTKILSNFCAKKCIQNIDKNILNWKQIQELGRKVLQR